MPNDRREVSRITSVAAWREAAADTRPSTMAKQQYPDFAVQQSPKDSVQGLAWSPVRNHLCAVAWDGSVSDPGRGWGLRKKLGTRAAALPSAVNPALFIQQPQATVYDVAGINNATVARQKMLTGPVLGVDWDPSGQAVGEVFTLALRLVAVSHLVLCVQVYLAGSDKTVKMWNITADSVQQIGSHDGPVRSVHWSPSSNVVVSTSWDKSCRVGAAP